MKNAPSISVPTKPRPTCDLLDILRRISSLLSVSTCVFLNLKTFVGSNTAGPPAEKNPQGKKSKTKRRFFYTAGSQKWNILHHIWCLRVQDYVDLCWCPPMKDGVSFLLLGWDPEPKRRVRVWLGIVKARSLLQQFCHCLPISLDTPFFHNHLQMIKKQRSSFILVHVFVSKIAPWQRWNRSVRFSPAIFDIWEATFTGCSWHPFSRKHKKGTFLREKEWHFVNEVNLY